jgi:Bacterial PH domain
MSHDDFAAEPDPAAPGQLPRGERILWQGKPDWRNLAWRVYHLREVVLYFSALVAWRGFSTWWDTGLIGQVLPAVAPLLIPAMLCAAILTLMAVLNARSSVYTLTDKRLVLRIGAALPTTFNLPFTAIGSADIKETGRGCGDISVALSTEDKLAYLMLWPHAKPWRLMKPEPMLRSVPEAAKVARLLASGLRQASDQSEAAQWLEMVSKTASNKPALGNELHDLGGMSTARS